MKSNEISAYQLRRCEACGVCRVDHFPSARCAKFVAKVESHQSQLSPEDNKFHQGAPDGKHYWVTPPELYQALDEEFDFDFDPAPFPLPEGFDGLTAEWGESSYLNPPFGSIMHEGRKKGPTAWVRKALTEWRKGKTVVMVYPIDKWVLMLLQAGAEVRNLGDVRWLATEDGTAGKGTGRHIACFVLRAASVPLLETPQFTHDVLHDAAAQVERAKVPLCYFCILWQDYGPNTPLPKHDFISAPVEPVSTLNYSKDLTVEPVPDWEDLYGRAAKLANEYETMARNSHDWMVDALAAANRDRDYLLAETLRLTKENNQAAPVPASHLEWENAWKHNKVWIAHVGDAGDGRWWQINEYEEHCELFLADEGEAYVGKAPSLDAAKSLAEKLNAVLSPPVGPQE